MAESDSTAFVREALDHAIEEVAKVEYPRLAEGMSLDDQRQHVNDALKSLKDLGRGAMPHYGKWVALFYLTWYQPRHIHLAYTVLDQQISTVLHRQISEQHRPRRVIDLGCGGWAVQIALAILITERPELQGLVVDGIDSSGPMRDIGELLWRKLRETVEKNANAPLLAMVDRAKLDTYKRLGRTLESMTNSCTCHASCDAYLSDGIKKPGNCWLTAFHVVYQSNRSDLEAVFQRIRRERSPVLELLTTDGVKRDHTTFFGGSDLSIKQAAWNCDQLKRTTHWRRELRNRLGVKGTADLIDNYLRTPVRWNPRSNPIEDDAVLIRGVAQ